MKIPVANTYIGEKEAIKAYNTIRGGWVSMGKQVKKFEENSQNMLIANMQ